MGFFSFRNRKESGEASVFKSRAEEPASRSRTRRKASEEDPVDPVLPEKQRARRRLIGALTLVLTAVVGLPMVLDSQPRPVAQDILIDIPSKDKPRIPAERSVPASASLDQQEEILPDSAARPASVPSAAATTSNIAATVATAATAATAAAVAAAAPTREAAKPEAKPDPTKAAKVDAPKSADAKAEPVKAEAAKPEAAKLEAARETPKLAARGQVLPGSRIDPPLKPAELKPADAKANLAADKAKTADKPKAQDKDKAKADNGAAQKAAQAKAAADKAAHDKAAHDKAVADKAKLADKNAKGERYQVQVAALGSADKARELQNKLKAAGIQAHTQKVSTQSGERVRVRIGPVTSKAEAEKIRAKLVKMGLSGTLVPA